MLVVCLNKVLVIAGPDFEYRPSELHGSASERMDNEYVYLDVAFQCYWPEPQEYEVVFAKRRGMREYCAVRPLDFTSITSVLSFLALPALPTPPPPLSAAVAPGTSGEVWLRAGWDCKLLMAEAWHCALRNWVEDLRNAFRLVAVAAPAATGPRMRFGPVDWVEGLRPAFQAVAVAAPAASGPRSEADPCSPQSASGPALHGPMQFQLAD